MAEGMAMHRAAESQLPEDERICFDPYAVHFIRPEILQFAQVHPEEAKRNLEEMERLFPGLSNSIRVRVRYFDDEVIDAVTEGFSQVVILGAGYDTRSLRIDALQNGVTIFEVDHPDTQSHKCRILQTVLGTLPSNTRYISVDVTSGDLWKNLQSNGYSSEKKTIFLMEGLSMYLEPEAVDALFKGVRFHCMKGSKIIFDFFPQSVVDGTHPNEMVKNMLLLTMMYGEPLKFGIPDETAEEWLEKCGFSNICIMDSESIRNTYFKGKAADRQICDILLFAEVSVREH